MLVTHLLPHAVSDLLLKHINITSFETERDRFIEAIMELQSLVITFDYK